VAEETTTTSVSNQVATGYNLAADFALRSIPVFDQFASVKTANTNEGDSITFHRWTDLPETVTPIDEVTDVTPVALSSSVFTVTPLEYGSTTVTTAKVRSDTMLSSFSADQVNLVARTMAMTVDKLARTAMETSTQEEFIGQATLAAITATDILTADEVRKQEANAQVANVQPLAGDKFIWMIHPHVSYDLKSETGDGAFIAPAQYVNTEKIYNNEIGIFAGFKFVESNRCLLTADAGAGNVDAYWNYIFGADAVAKAVSIAPALVEGPVTDYLLRLKPLGWYGYFGYGIFRNEAMRLLIGASSMGANT
jgi:N4-gp56 family major capsid protein